MIPHPKPNLKANLLAIKIIAPCALFLAVTALSNAQTVFRMVGPDGAVTFSDKAPTPSNAKLTTGAGATAATGASSTSGISVLPGAVGGGNGGASLPYELRQVVQKYPVTLYTGENCSPCQLARSMLITRGVPFLEKTVTTAQDSQALLRLSGENSLPLATLGGQQLKGFLESEWTQFLTAAGYPATSVLPASYRQSAASPLVAFAAAPSATAAPASPVQGAAAQQPAPAGANPSGIRF